MRKLWQQRIAPYIKDDVRRLCWQSSFFPCCSWAWQWARAMCWRAADHHHPSQSAGQRLCGGGGSRPALVNAALVALIAWPSSPCSRWKSPSLHCGGVYHGGSPASARMSLISFPSSPGSGCIPAIKVSACAVTYFRLFWFGPGSHRLSNRLWRQAGVAAGGLAGVAAGFIISPLAAHLLRNHQGLNLYNLGFTAGMVGMLFASMLRGWATRCRHC